MPNEHCPQFLKELLLRSENEIDKKSIKVHPFLHTVNSRKHRTPIKESLLDSAARNSPQLSRSYVLKSEPLPAILHPVPHGFKGVFSHGKNHSSINLGEGTVKQRYENQAD